MTDPAAAATGRARRACMLAGAAALGGLLVPGARALAGGDAGPAVPRVRWPALRLLDGCWLDPAELHDTALVWVFFTTGCPYCRRHNARVDQLARSSRGQALRVVGVAGDSDPDAVRSYLRHQGLGFDVALDDGSLRTLMTPHRVVPLTCVLDRAGRLREVIPGEMAEDDVRGLARWGAAA